MGKNLENQSPESPAGERQKDLQQQRDKFEELLGGDGESIEEYAREEHALREEAKKGDEEILKSVPPESVETVRKALRENLEKVLETGGKTHELILESVLSKEDTVTGAKVRAEGVNYMKDLEKKNIPFAVAVFDLDHFKKINDTYGHPAGDKILREFVRRISINTRREDMVVRWGGEEFVLIIPQISRSDAAIRVNKLIRIVGDNNFKISDEFEIRVTASAGVAEYTPNGEKEKNGGVVGKADDALYAAKESGRDRVYYTDEQGEALEYAAENDKKAAKSS